MDSSNFVEEYEKFKIQKRIRKFKKKLKILAKPKQMLPCSIGISLLDIPKQPNSF